MALTGIQPSCILYGACDRHNLGDLLFPHIVAELLAPHEVVVAGLAARDMRPFGGHRVRAIGEVVRELPDAPVIHVGGELLCSDAWEAAVMLLPSDEAPAVIARYDGRPERFDWAARYLGMPDRAPYCLGKSQSPQYGEVIFNGVGGVDLDRRDAALRGEVLAKLAAADWIGVRDRVTLSHLAAAGIDARLMPDPAVLTAELFGERICERAETGEVAAMRNVFPQGYIAVQFAASHGDDATLAAIAERLAGQAAGRGIVFFRAGAAPWHDDLDVYRRAAARLPDARLFESLDIWDICALVTASVGFAGSSLHGRIVAEAFGVPAALIEPRDPAAARKRHAVIHAWACEPQTARAATVRAAISEWRSALPHRHSG